MKRPSSLDGPVKQPARRPNGWTGKFLICVNGKRISEEKERIFVLERHTCGWPFEDLKLGEFSKMVLSVSGSSKSVQIVN